MSILKHDLRGFADALDKLERFGKAADEPEGARFVQLSDTIAKAIALELRDVHRERLEWLSGRIWTPDGATTVGTVAPEAPPDAPGGLEEEYRPVKRRDPLPRGLIKPRGAHNPDY